MFGYGFFRKDTAPIVGNNKKVECDATTILSCSTAASLGDGALVGGLLAASGKSLLVAAGAGAATCGVSTIGLLGCGFLFCYKAPEKPEVAEVLVDEEDELKSYGAINFTPPSALDR